MTTTHELSPTERPADPEALARPDGASVDQQDDPVVPPIVASDVHWPTDAMDTSWVAFRTAAARYGYDEGRASTMYAAVPSLHIDAEVAARWMEAGFTTWATRVWIEAGFDAAAADEAAEYQRWMYTAEDAYWARRDGTSRATLEQRRALLELLIRR